MDEREILRNALALLQRQDKDVRGGWLSYRVYGDRIVIVMVAGYKYTVPLSELSKPKEIAIDQGDFKYTLAAFKLAQVHDIDLTTITGTGKDGRITVLDIKKIVEPETPEEPTPEEPTPEEPTPEEPTPEEPTPEEPTPEEEVL